MRLLLKSIKGSFSRGEGIEDAEGKENNKI